MIIRRLERLLGARDARHVSVFLCAVLVASLLQGLTFLLVIPFLCAVLGGALMSALFWSIGIVALAVACWWATHRAALNGFELALAMLHQVRTRVGEHLVRLPLGWFTPLRTARLAATISQGVMELLALPAHQLMPLLQALVVPPLMVLGMALFDGLLALTAAVLFPLMAAVYWWAGRLGQAADRKAQQAAEDASQRVVEFAQAQDVLRAFGITSRGQSALQAALREQARTGRRQLWMVMPPLLANSWLVQLGYLALMAVAVHLALGADASRLPMLVAVMVLVNRILEPLGDVAASGAGIRMASAELGRVEALLAAPSLPLPASPAAMPQNRDITFTDVTFSHAPDMPVFKGFNLHLAQGETTALVGASGAGKSTLLHLVARFMDVEGGKVAIGGVDVRDLAPEKLASFMAPVFQNAHLFPGTIRENVLLGRPDAMPHELEHVASLTRLDDMLTRLPGGWNCAVGEGGHGLSGGERQRICMARAVLKNAPILLLDEPTSALDAENRVAMSELLAKLRGHMTILLVAHQIDWTREADRVLVLDHGRLVEDGAPACLLAQNGPYAALSRLHATPVGWHSAV